ncbi:MAG TPA: L-seryl-tRNA(Sec) selenium transferase [Pyrinomonadaceae bacterium]|nr:L-seryl-tRNA(Sec) selenium transferase [Pyrinomonadaceae bacterium]
MPNQSPSQEANLRAIPSVDHLLRADEIAPLKLAIGLPQLTAIVRDVADKMRARLRSSGPEEQSSTELFAEAILRIQSICENESRSAIRNVINATGVILHTNLGRAPLSDAARAAIQTAAGYCTVEYDASRGERGKRGGRVEQLLIQLTGAEAALVVNNCAAASLLILTALASQGETVVSRGELVEIGGDFRVPDVMANSGTQMVEVGTTNRTHLNDYAQALTKNTRLVMRVHPSNYRIVGFTHTPTLKDLVSLAHEHDLVMYEDAGSGVLSDLSRFGLKDEPIISESVAAGADVVSFSGDKLLGATQAGLIVGRQEIIDRLRQHSLYRALRVDKLFLAALEATLEAHRRRAFDEIPALKMLGTQPNVIEARAQNLMAQLTATAPGITATLLPGQSAVGGGSGPTLNPPTTLIALKHPTLSSSEIEARLRTSSPPIISRIADDAVLLDLRTVAVAEESDLLQALAKLDT